MLAEVVNGNRLRLVSTGRPGTTLVTVSVFDGITSVSQTIKVTVTDQGSPLANQLFSSFDDTLADALIAN